MIRTMPRAAQRPLTGACRVPGDKSISHRAVILASLAEGTSRFGGYSTAGDCAATLAAVAVLGARVRRQGDRVEVTGAADHGGGARLELDCSRSGTTMRLLAGAVAGHPREVELTGHPQLLQRPMERVAVPLREMGAEVTTGEGGRPPIRVRGGGLRGIVYSPPVASAQVKSAVLLAGLTASGRTEVMEPIPTRDHTERMLAAAGAKCQLSRSESGARVTLEASPLRALTMAIPGDASSAAVLATAAALVPGSDIRLEAVSGNPTRCGFLEVLRRMGGSVEMSSPEDSSSPEPVVAVRVRQASLRATLVGPDEVPMLIDELPLVGLLATQAEGDTEVRGAAELRVKESDRIHGLVEGLRALGGDAEELPDGFVVRGPRPLRGALCDSLTDHRLAMTFALAALVAQGPVGVEGMEFVEDSFPGFETTLGSLR